MAELLRAIFNPDKDPAVAPPGPEGNYPKIVQLSLSNIKRTGCRVNFELDRNGDLYWGIWVKGLPFNKSSITSGSLSSAYGVESALGDEFTSFVINTLAQGTEYVFAYYTKDINAESDILEEIEFKTTGVNEPGLVATYGDAYREEYG